MKEQIFLTEEQKPAALAALYNASQPLGLGFIHYTSEPMTAKEAAILLQKERYFDYIKGRVMKLDFTRDRLDLRLYDRDNGYGAGIKALTKANIFEEEQKR